MKFRTVLSATLLVGLLATSAFAAKPQTTYVPVGKGRIELNTSRGGKTTLTPLKGAPVTFKGRVLGLTGEGQVVVKLGKHSGGGHMAINPRTGDTSKMPAGSASAIQKLIRQPLQ